MESSASNSELLSLLQNSKDFQQQCIQYVLNNLLTPNIIPNITLNDVVNDEYKEEEQYWQILAAIITSIVRKSYSSSFSLDIAQCIISFARNDLSIAFLKDFKSRPYINIANI